MTSIMFSVIKSNGAIKVSVLIDYVMNVINSLKNIGLELRIPSAIGMLPISDG